VLICSDMFHTVGLTTLSVI